MFELPSEYRLPNLVWCFRPCNIAFFGSLNHMHILTSLRPASHENLDQASKQNTVVLPRRELAHVSLTVKMEYIFLKILNNFFLAAILDIQFQPKD